MNKENGIAHIAIVAVLIVTLGIGAAAWKVTSNNSSDESPAASQTNDEGSDDVEEINSEGLENIKTVDEIRAISLASSSETAVLSIELELEDGVLVYKVTFTDGSEKVYNAESGELINNDANDSDKSENDEGEEDDEKPNGESFNPNRKVGLTVANAIAIARDQFPGSRVEKVEVEIEDGIVVFSVRFTNDARVDIDSESGEVVRTDQPDDDDADRDDRDKDNNASEDED